jgi:hypothetical protein
MDLKLIFEYLTNRQFNQKLENVMKVVKHNTTLFIPYFAVFTQYFKHSSDFKVYFLKFELLFQIFEAYFSIVVVTL